jgi:hypothetical protein
VSISIGKSLLRIIVKIYWWIRDIVRNPSNINTLLVNKYTLQPHLYLSSQPFWTVLLLSVPPTLIFRRSAFLLTDFIDVFQINVTRKGDHALCNNERHVYIVVVQCFFCEIATKCIIIFKLSLFFTRFKRFRLSPIKFKSLFHLWLELHFQRDNFNKFVTQRLLM